MGPVEWNHSYAEVRGQTYPPAHSPAHFLFGLWANLTFGVLLHSTLTEC